MYGLQLPEADGFCKVLGVVAESEKHWLRLISVAHAAGFLASLPNSFLGWLFLLLLVWLFRIKRTSRGGVGVFARRGLGELKTQTSGEHCVEEARCRCLRLDAFSSRFLSLGFSFLFPGCESGWCWIVWGNKHSDYTGFRASSGGRVELAGRRSVGRSSPLHVPCSSLGGTLLPWGRDHRLPHRVRGETGLNSQQSHKPCSGEPATWHFLQVTGDSSIAAERVGRGRLVSLQVFSH